MIYIVQYEGLYDSWLERAFTTKSEAEAYIKRQSTPLSYKLLQVLYEVGDA